MTDYDELTNLLNRGQLNKVAKEIFEKQDIVCILFINITEFIWINHIYGHLEGDKVLIKLGEMLQKFINKDEDFVFRFGGDKFIVLYSKLNIKEVTEVAKKVFEEFQNLEIKYIKNDGQSYYLNLNIDVMLVQKDYFDEKDFLIRKALHNMIDDEKFKQGYKSGVFVIDCINKSIEKII